MVYIEVCNVVSADRAARFKAAIEGKTYMNFQVTVAPYQGMYVVSVEADADSAEEAMGMLLHIMFYAMTEEK